MESWGPHELAHICSTSLEHNTAERVIRVKVGQVRCFDQRTDVAIDTGWAQFSVLETGDDLISQQLYIVLVRCRIDFGTKQVVFRGIRLRIGIRPIVHEVQHRLNSDWVVVVKLDHTLLRFLLEVRSASSAGSCLREDTTYPELARASFAKPFRFTADGEAMCRYREAGELDDHVMEVVLFEPTASVSCEDRV